MKTPLEVVQRWIELFNQADADGLAELYHEDAINHQSPNLPIQGRDALRELFAREFATAKMICLPDHLIDSGEWVAMEWQDPLGLRGAGFFQVVDGRIKLQRGYWDKLSFLRMHGMPFPSE